MEKINQITTGKAKSLYTTNDEQYLVMEFRTIHLHLMERKRLLLKTKVKLIISLMLLLWNFSPQKK